MTNSIMKLWIFWLSMRTFFVQFLTKFNIIVLTIFLDTELCQAKYLLDIPTICSQILTKCALIRNILVIYISTNYFHWTWRVMYWLTHFILIMQNSVFFCNPPLSKYTCFCLSDSANNLLRFTLRWGLEGVAFKRGKGG